MLLVDDRYLGLGIWPIAVSLFLVFVVDGRGRGRFVSCLRGAILAKLKRGEHEMRIDINEAQCNYRLFELIML